MLAAAAFDVDHSALDFVYHPAPRGKVARAGSRVCPSLGGCSVGQDACSTRLRAVRGTPWRDTEHIYTNHDF